MRTIQAYLEAAKERRENGESGFSLVELIVVVVILGILAAVAIPIFIGIQDQAEQSAVDAAAANMASQAVANLANPDSAGAHGVPASKDGIAYTVAPASPTITNVCVTAAKDGKTASKGPGCA
ncbi:prepilin-type N-terminal cleavage/methylation domain-containing protein [Leucobacter weissii]|uniref:Prepilin-type N-terminal cleavage/methylation domain-containing protein n=1 Tax=Leucobacter weissii TaxID=1983706 RepID=A0A939SB73_9MICO|nr:prepilin-type N-terminal cleavage/methylation domain-containing protein [Leucobacter weissii]MBO1901108.1 prepilin-type N-terminal cleavage/methylation domain-containing protein [Leucobacter weissii]